jgi:hypothetical protein
MTDKIGQIDTRSKHENAEKRQENDQIIDKINEIVRDTESIPASSYSFLRTYYEDICDGTLQESTVFKETPIYQGNEIRLVVRGEGNADVYLYGNKTPIPGGVIFFNGAESTQSTAWLPFEGDDKTVSLFRKSKGNSWNFDDGDYSFMTWITTGNFTLTPTGGYLQCAKASGAIGTAVGHFGSTYAFSVFDLTLDVKLVSNQGNYYVFIAFDVVDLNNFKYFALHKNGARIAKVVAGVHTVLSSDLTPNTVGAWYTIGVNVDGGGYCDATVAGVTRLTYTFTGAEAVGTNYLGFGHYSSTTLANTVHFDNFIIDGAGILYDAQVQLRR